MLMEGIKRINHSISKERERKGKWSAESGIIISQDLLAVSALFVLLILNNLLGGMSPMSCK